MNQLKKIEKIERKDIESIIALTPMQEGMLFHYLKDPDSDYYFEQLSLELSGKMDSELFEKAWNFVIQYNEMLRTTFRWEKLEKPVQIILKVHQLQPIYYDFLDRDVSKKESVTGRSEKKTWIEEIKVKDRNEKFDLREVPFRVTLCRSDRDRYEMIISNHHILYDGWSNGIILQEFFQVYEKLSKGKPLTAPVKVEFKEFVKWVQDRETKNQKKFWQDNLNGFDIRTGLPIKRENRENRARTTVKNYNHRFSREVSEKAERFVKKHKLTMASLLYGVWGLLLQRYNNCGDVVFGTTVSGRSAKIKGIEDMVGLFINTLPLRLHSPADERLMGLLNRVDGMLLTREDYESTPLVDINRYSEIDNKSELFDSLVVMENYPISARLKGQNGILALRSYSMFEKTHYALTLQITLIDHIEMCFQYNSALWDESFIAKVARDFMTVTCDIVIDPGKMVSEIDILSSEEKNQILYEFNGTGVVYPKDKTIHELFEAQVEKTPGSIAAQSRGKTLTYRQLNEKSNQLAHLLRNKGVKPDDLIGIMVKRSLDMMMGLLAILKSGAAYVPIDPEYPLNRIQYMLKDSSAILLLTQQDILKKYRETGVNIEFIDVTDENLYNVNQKMKSHNIAVPNNLAYVIYTSGSTGKPKGVTIRHRNAVNFFKGMIEEIDFSPVKSILALTTICFDIFLLETLLPVTIGLKVVIAEESQQRDPEALKKLIIDSGVNLLQLTPSRLKLLLSNGNDSDYLKEIKYILVGGEQFPEALFEELKGVFKDNIINVYGPTETTVWSTMQDLTGKKEIDIGFPIANTQLYIVNKYMMLQPIGIVGELYIGGDGLSRGYLNQPELTSEKFVENPFELIDDPDRPYKEIYQTGDLARWLPDGNVEFLGRKDHQVKIRGYRIELGEIENKISNYHNWKIRDVVVVDREDKSGDKYLCAYIVSNPAAPLDKTPSIALALREYLSKELPDYMVPSYWVQLEELPLTTSGKVNRKALPEPGPMTKEEEYTAPVDEVEETLVELFREVLGVDRVGRNDDFFMLGGHSLKAILLISKICKTFNIDFPLNKLFKTAAVKGLADYIKKSRKHLYEDITSVEKKEYYPLSSAQKRLFFLDHFEHIGTTYNMPFVLKVEGKIHKDRFEGAFNQLIQRHDTLRASFEFIGKQPVQRVYDPDTTGIDFKIQEIEYTAGDRNIDRIINDFVRAFNLKRPPLLRVALIRLCENKHILLFDMHHIISDGTSTGVLIDQFTRLYNGEILQSLRVQFRDFSVWQNKWVESGKINDQEEFWCNIYSDDIPKLDLPADFPRPTNFTFAGDRFGFKLGAEEIVRLKEISAKKGVTLFMSLMAVFNILLYKYTAEEDIVVGTAAAGRSHPDLRHNIGMFVNMLALRNYPAGTKTYGEFLKEVKHTSIEAFENQDLQFEAFVDGLNVDRDASRNPVFDVCLVIQNFERKEIQLPGLTFSPYEYVDKISQFDIALDVWELGDDMVFYLEYYTALFKRTTIERFSRHFLNIIGQICKDTDVLIADIDIVSREEKRRLIDEFNKKEVFYPLHKTIHQLFNEQVERMPDNIAVVGDELCARPGIPGTKTRGIGTINPLVASVSGAKNMHITGKELDEKSNQLANYLCQTKHNTTDDIVGIMMDRSIDCVLAIIGILKAGAAYIPIDPLLPEKRIKGILKDAGVGIVISQKRYLRILNQLQWECDLLHTYLCMDSWDIYSEEEVEESELLNLKKLWNYIGETASDEIAGGGWVSSYTGEPMSKQEMDEYGDNILKKLTPLLHKKMKVLEIGCASGITMFRLASQVGVYYGTDLSEAIIHKNKKRVKEEGLGNITLAALPAHEIDKIKEKNLDLVIINSVIQDFPGLNYLRMVIGKAIALMGDRGYLFIGDVMDQDLKDDLSRAMVEFKKNNQDKKYKTKTDFSGDLFVSRKFFQDLGIENPALKAVEFSRKIFTIENELTQFRYDALFKVEQSTKKRTPVKKRKWKYQDGLSALVKYNKEKMKSPANGDNLAYIMYTSGSTGKPKGVMVAHRNVVNLTQWFIRTYKMQPGTHLLQLTDYSFDPSVEDIFATLHSGATLYVGSRDLGINKETFCQFVKRHQIHIIDFVPSALNQLLCHEEKLESLKVVISGGERLEDSVKNRIIEKGYRLYNNYGPTEITVDALSSICSQKRVHLGKPVSNTRCFVVDKDSNLAAIGVKGELCIAGAGVSRGYLNDPELTALKMAAGLVEKERVYRTGDIVRWLPDGNIEFFGRKDYQVKIRGYRIEVGEIEEKIKAIDCIQDAVVIDHKKGITENYLCAYFVSGIQVEVSDLKSILARDLPDYMIPVFFKQLAEIPRKTTGKVDKKRLPEPGASIVDDNYTAPRDYLEKKLIAVWSEVLAIAKEEIGIDSNFFELGGHSLKATVLTANIHKELDVKVPLAEIFKTPTIRGLSRYLRAGAADIYTSIEVAEKKEYYALSSAQKRLYVLQQMGTNTIGYNELSVLELVGEPDRENFEETFRKLIKRHENLRTSFKLVTDEPGQVIHDEVQFEIEYHDISEVEVKVEEKERPFGKINTCGEGEGESAAALIISFIRPFDLSQAPLFRVGLKKHEREKHLLLMDIHHIITDGTSQGIFINDFMALYEGKNVPELRVQYKDFAEWQNKEKHKRLMKRQEEYWVKEFKDEIPVLNLPYDFVRPRVQSFEGSRIDFKLNAGETRRLTKLAKETDATLFMVLLAIYNILLSKLSGQEDIIIGIPISGRRHSDLQQIMGMFVNTLALRNHPRRENTFKEFLKQLRERTLEAFENQDYQFEDLVEQAAVSRDASRNPVFDSMFALHNMERSTIEIPGLKLKPYNYEKSISKFDLSVQVIDQEDKLQFAVEYCTKLFEKRTIERFIIYFTNFVSSILKEQDARICEIEIITGEEKNQVLHEFNDTGAEYPRGKMIHQLFGKQVERTPDCTAVVGVGAEGGSIPKRLGPISVTYRELNEKSNRLAHLLEERGVRVDTIVGIMMERSMEMITGLLGILKAGGAYLPIDLEYPKDRINYMLADSGAKILLGMVSIASKVRGAIEVIELNKVFENIEKAPSQHPNPAQSICLNYPTHPLAHSHPQLCYIIYTSGTTGRPKGVMVEHRNVINVITWFARSYFLGPGVRIIQMTEYTFDASVNQVFSPLTHGASLHVISKALVMNTVELRRYIGIHRIHIINFVPLVLRELLAVEPKLESLNIVISGADQLDYKTKDKLLKMGYRLYNHYGPTEATIDALAWQCLMGEEVKLGKPMANVCTYIVDRSGCLLPIGVTGELVIAGAGIARGYLNNPELTAEKFDHDLWDLQDYHDEEKKGTIKKYNKKFLRMFHGTGAVFSKRAPGRRRQKIYKTGDLARWLSDGNIEFLGRMDHQVKLRGNRIELGEIENRLLMNEEIKEAVVVDKEEENGDRYLCAYIVSEKELEISGLWDYLSLELPDYMIPSYIVQVDHIPLTHNGKIDRKSLPAPGIEREKNYAAPRDDVEKKLVDLWSDILEVEKEKISINANFFHLGGHSLKAARLAAKIHKELDVDVPLSQIFRTSSISGLAGYIKHAVGQKFKSIELVEKKEYYILSSAQKRLFILQQMDKNGIGYNMPSVWQLEGNFDGEKFGSIFHKLIQRHESLRTSFIVLNDEPVQQVHEGTVIGHWPLVIDETGKSEIKDIIKKFIKPFDLTRTPLLRVDLIKTVEQKHVLMVDMHHIISDGMSVGIFVKEFMELYAGMNLSGLRLQYKDYSEWYNRSAGREYIKEQETYWLKQFEGEVPVLDLPADYPRPMVQDFAGRTLHFEIDMEETTALKSLARQQNVTLFMLLLSLYTIFLCKLSGQEDIVVGTPIANRRHANLESIIGMFVNILALRNFPVGEKNFQRFLGEIKENTIKAFENQVYPFEELVEKIDLNRDAGRNPLFEVLFTLQDLDIDTIRIPGLKMESYDHTTDTSKFDLMFQAVEKEENLCFIVEYRTKIFKETTIRRFIGYFNKIVAVILENPAVGLEEIEIIPGSEKHQILYQFNNTASEYPKDKRIQQLLEEEVEKRPDRAALAYHFQILTYRALDQLANQFARHFRLRGLQPEALVGIMSKTSLETIAAVLAALKAGGAYLPIDPNYPLERINLILMESNAQLVVTTRSWEIKGLGLSQSKVDKDILYLEDCLLEARGDSGYFPPFAADSNLAYVIYTSGSTGRPKGVMVKHQNVIRLLINTNYIDFKPDDRILQTSALEFDASTFEIWGALLNGLTLFLAAKEDILTPGKLKTNIEDNQITTMWLTSPLFNHMVRDDLEIFAGLRVLLVGGDVLSPLHINRVRRRLPELHVINGYGPTENTTFSTTFLIDKEYEVNIPIGKPIANSTAYVVDRSNNLQAIGIAGELWVGGDGVAAGYLNNPELTSEKFIKQFAPTFNTHRCYRTGDLVRYLQDGNIQFLGRIDNQVKIRGFRIEVGEIETQLIKHEQIKEAVVLKKKINHGDNCLCAYIVADNSDKSEKMLDCNELRDNLSQVLPGYMIPAYFVPLNELPLNLNGKLDRKALSVPDKREPGQDYTAPRDDVEKKLTKIWGEVLGIEQEAIGIDSNFFDLGGHSLKATIFVAKLHRTSNVKFSLTDFFQAPTIREIANYIRGAVKQKFFSIEPIERKEYYSLSSAQERLFTIEKLGNTGNVYNISAAWVIKGRFEKNLFQDTFNSMIKRHDSLRTSFTIIDGQPVQVIHEHVNFEIESLKLSGHLEHGEPAIESVINDFVKPFDLEKPPLLTALLVDFAREEHLFLLDMHHIISDGFSNGVFIKDFMALYRGIEPQPLRVQYKDFAQWQNRNKDSEAQKRQEKYWLGEFSDGVPVVDIPTDFPRPAVQSFEGDIFHFVLDNQLSAQLLQLTRQTETTLNMILLAAYAILLSKYSGQKDIVVGLGISGRTHPDVENIIGFFVNTLPIRLQPQAHKTYGKFLQEVRRTTLEGYENQEYPFEELVRKLGVTGDFSQNPLFNAAFVVQNMEIDKIEIEGLEITPYQFKARVSRFDFQLEASETGDIISMALEYSTTLFKPEWAEKFAERYVNILEQVVENNEIKLEDIVISHRLAVAKSVVFEETAVNFDF